MGTSGIFLMTTHLCSPSNSISFPSPWPWPLLPQLRTSSRALPLLRIRSSASSSSSTTTTTTSELTPPGEGIMSFQLLMLCPLTNSSMSQRQNNRIDVSLLLKVSYLYSLIMGNRMNFGYMYRSITIMIHP